MDNESLLQGLTDAGYTGPLLEDAAKFQEALEGGAKSPEFTKVVAWLTDQICSFSDIDETVHATSTPEDSSHFLLELSTFLKELGCMNAKLTSGNANQRLATVEERFILLDYLIKELMACKIIENKKGEDKKAVQITISESITAKCMREMLSALRFQKPPANISSAMLFSKLHTKITELMKQIPKELLGKPLFGGTLSNEQWEKLDKLHSELNEDYTIRREMLLKRLDVTIQSFAWSERIRPKEDELTKVYNAKRDTMKREPDVTLAHLLSARDDLAVIEKTSSASVRKNTRSAINKVMIGAVPDRGGRPCEQEPPPPEMPPWQKDRVQGPPRGGFSGGGGRGGGGGGRGGGGGGRGGRGGGGGGGGGYRDNKSASSNFGQNFDQPQQQYNTFSNQTPQYTQAAGYSSQGSFAPQGQSSGYRGGSGGYNNQGSGGYNNQGSGGYNNQGSGGYNNQGSGYSNQGYGNQGGYDRKSGGSQDFNRGGQHRGGRVQGNWNQGGDSNYNRGGYNNRGQGGGRRY